MAVAIVLLVRNRPGSSQVQPIDGLGGLAHDRDALLHEADMLQRRIHDWRRRATAADVHVDLDLGQDNAGAGSAGARFRGDLGDGTAASATVGSSNSLAVGGGGSASSGAEAGSSSGTCDPNGHPVTTVAPIDPQYLMRPAAEVEAENPEFAALLKKHSNDKQEVRRHGVARARVCGGVGGGGACACVRVISHCVCHCAGMGVGADHAGTSKYWRGFGAQVGAKAVHSGDCCSRGGRPPAVGVSAGSTSALWGTAAHGSGGCSRANQTALDSGLRARGSSLWRRGLAAHGERSA